MLAEVQTNRNSQLPTSKNLLVLGKIGCSHHLDINRGLDANSLVLGAGDKESGKTTLMAKIQGNEDPKKGAGLEYCYIDVRDEYRDGKKKKYFK